MLTPILHDTPGEIAQAFDVKDWKTGEIDPIPGKTMPQVTVVERDYPNLYKRFTSLGPLMAKLGNGGKGIAWNTEHEVELLKRAQWRSTGGRPDQGPGADRYRHRRLRSDPRPRAGDQRRGRGQRRGTALAETTGREHAHLALHKEDEKIRFRDVVAQPRKIISSPIWSGLESDEGLLQRRLHQRPRVDTVADADRPPAALPGSPVDARLRRGLLRLSSADRYQERSSRSSIASRTATRRSSSISSRPTRNGASTPPTPTTS